MMRHVFLPVLLAAVLVGLSTARAESPSELLEKGIYTEQTVGDLDAAMVIYRKIVAQEKENRPAAAEKLRLGLCQLKKGDKAEATRSFEDLVKRFPDQKDEVAQAREHIEPALKLEPVPWADGEVLDMVFKLGGGEEIGKCVYTAEQKDIQGKKVWLVGNRLSIAAGTSQSVSRVEVDSATFRPIRSHWELSVMGCFDAEYAPSEVALTSTVQGKKSVRKIPLDKIVYDNEQGAHLFRRLPLAVGQKFTVPIFVSLSTAELPLGVEVTKKEKIKVPAGEFECFRLELNIGQVFWISTDAKRYMVKFEAGGVSGELVAIDPPKPNEFSDAELGTSLAAPVGWYFFKCPKLQKPGKVVVDVLEPEAKAFVGLTTETLDHLKPEEKANVRTLADLQLVGLKKALKDPKVRPDSWTPREISGRPAMSFTADYVNAGRKMVAYVVSVLGESTATVFLVTIPADAFDTFKKTIDPVIDGCKVK